MRIRLYQIDTALEREFVKYLSYENTIRRIGAIDPKMYRVVFEGEVECADPEEVYKLFNVGEKPANYHGASMSVSDVLYVMGGTNVIPGFYFCDTIGFKKIDFDPEKVSDGAML